MSITHHIVRVHGLFEVTHSIRAVLQGLARLARLA
jgi:ribosomal protein L30/L7E